MTARRLEGLVASFNGGLPADVVGLLGVLEATGMAVAIAGPSDGEGVVAGGVPAFGSVDEALATFARRGISDSDVAVVESDVGEWAALRDLVVDQVRRRERRELPSVALDPLWCLVIDGFDPDVERSREALVALANGTVGAGGATVADHPTVRRWLLANGLYEGDGPETRLLPGPVGLHVPYSIALGTQARRVLDLRSGTLYEETGCDAGTLRSLRFASAADGRVLAMRVSCPDQRTGALLVPSTEGRAVAAGDDGGVAWMSAGEPSAGGITVAAHEDGVSVDGGVVRDRVIVHDAGHVEVPPAAATVDHARAVAAIGFDRLLAEHREVWARRWEDADIAIEGDEELQLATRFALFHLMATVPDDGEAAVGARGLTGEGYRGHVFWDADTFVLPFLAATRPPAARAMLEYRLRRLGAALAIAQSRQRAGARFPWESARSGFDVTPSHAKDRLGRVVAIRTGQLEEHIVAQIPWAACCYVDWTGDDEFAQGPGLHLLTETARYWRSRVRREPDGTAHIYGVIGPDEYHEPVDDNAFTNVMARWNLRTAADAVDASPTPPAGVGADEVLAWREIADHLVDGYDDHTGVYEQFAGFHRLEAIMIEEVAPSRPIAADLLLGSERVGRAQVLKQADVLMLHHLLPDAVAPNTLEPNLRFYEPRTAHGSSLSPAIHASLLARARDHRRALEALRVAARIDLDDLTGSSAAGMHLASMGGLWQALVFGFAGARPSGGQLRIDPHLPPTWGALNVRVRFHGSLVDIRIARDLLTVHSDPPVPVVVGSAAHTVGASGLQLVRRGAAWEATS